MGAVWPRRSPGARRGAGAKVQTMTKPSRPALAAAALVLALLPLAGPARASGDHSHADRDLSWRLLETPTDTARLRGLAPVGVGWCGPREAAAP